MMPLVILNPGHHIPEDPGACGNNLREADLTLAICNLIAKYLPQYGIDSVTVHSNDLADICTKANAHTDAALFVSVHVNAGGGTGFETYIFPNSDKSENLCFYLHVELANFYRQLNFADRGKKMANFAVLRGTDMPAILTENLFIDNQNDALKLKDPAFLDGIAKAHVKGIARALGCAYKGEAEAVVPDWAKDAIMWAVARGIIVDQVGDETFYRLITALYRYDQQKG